MADDRHVPAYEVAGGNSGPEALEGYWAMAKGLQAVDSLTTSAYLDDVAARNIDGEITAAESAEIVSRYYEQKEARACEAGTMEADIVSSRIVALLDGGAYSYRPSILKLIHGKLFEGLIDTPYDYAFRDYNISKREPVLSGRSVEYAPWQLIADDLDYDFGHYDPKTAAGVRDGSREALAGLVGFTADVWQAHPFVEGNTRTVAVFVVMTLRNLGFEVDDTPFEKDSLFFRNALVRANFSSMSLGVEADTSHLERFFENLLTGERHVLRNRDLYCEELFRFDGRPSPAEAFSQHEAER